MGVVNNVGIDKYPKQGEHKRVMVCFNYDTTRKIGGMIVRSDNEEPWIDIILLDDGRYILTTECQYQFA